MSAASRLAKAFAIMAALVMLLMVADSTVVNVAFAEPVISPTVAVNNNTTPPPPSAVPFPPPEEPQRPVEPGTITQGWDNGSFAPAQIADHRALAMQQIGNETWYDTAVGNFVLNRSSPYFVRVASPGSDAEGIAESAFLVLYQGLKLLSPSNGTVDKATSDELSFHYGMYLSAALLGTMKVDYRFHGDANKITISFSPSVGLAKQYQIVWLTFTTFDAIDTAYPSDVEQRFEDLDGRYGSLFLGANVGTLYGTGTIQIPGAFIRPQKIVGSPGGPDLRMDVSDAASDFNGTYAGELTLREHSGNAVLTTFVAGNLTIDPQLILNGVDQDATAYSGIQRKTFFDGDRYWLFYKYTGGGVSEARYRSSLDGRSWTSFSDAIQIPGTLSYDFTVANSGKTVAVFWVNSASLLAIQIRTGLIVGDAIQWDDAGHQLFSGNNNIRRPVSATFTSQGSQFGITWSDTGGAVGFARYSCTGQGAAGFSPCATQVQSGSVDWGYGAAGGYQYSVVAPFFTGSGDIARFKIDSVPLDGKSYVRAKVYHSDGTNCGDAADIGHSTAENRDAWMTDGLFTAAASGKTATIFFFDTAAFTLYSYNIFSNCNPQADLVRGLGTANVKYLTAGTEQGGGALYLFYTVNGVAWYVRALADGANSFPATTIMQPYTNPNYVTAAAASSHFIPLMFTRAYPPPPGISDGCTTSWSNWCLYYVNYPLPLDGEAAVNNPWALKLGAPFVTETGGVVSPTTGLLAYGQVLVAGMPSINLVYREPGLFSWDATNGIDLKYTSTDQRYEIVPGIYYDLPWLEGDAGGILHLRGGQKFPLSLTGSSGSLRWYNNTRGVRYTLRYDGTTTQWTLTLPTGAYTVFNSNGDPIWTYLDATGQNYLQYNGMPGVTNAYIADASGRRITFTATGLSYGNGQTIGLTNLGVPVGCSGGTSGESAILQVTDAIGRVAKYSVCHWKLTKFETAMGGRVDYTYAVYNANPGTGNQVWQGTEAYSLPLLRMDVYNESGANVKSRSRAFDWNFQNGEVVRAVVNTTDKSAVVQGSNEYIFNSAGGTASVRVYDSAGQVLYYDMETCTASPCGSNPMKDLSGNANSGTFGGSGYTFPSAKYGKATNFAGAAWTQAADSNSLDATRVTLSAWINPSSIIGTKRIISKWGDTVGERSYLLSMGDSGTNGKIRFAVEGTFVYVDSAAIVSTSNWWHVAGTFDGKTATVYVNGVSSGSSSLSSSGNSIQVTTTPVRIGDEGDGSGTYKFSGVIDEVRIFNRELSPEDVGVLYSKNALKKSEQQNWYSINDQPHMVEGSVGDETSASVVTQDGIDDWGNQIYHRDALGNETFAAYANTNHQNHFYAPGRLTRNGGTLFDTEFIDFREGTFPPGNSWSVLSAGQSINLDYSTFSKMTPSLKLTNSASAAVDIEHVSPLTQLSGMPRFIEFRAKVDASQDFQVWFQKSSGALLAGVAFTSTGAIQVYNNYLAPGPYWASCTYPGGGSVTYMINTWYRFTLEFDRDTSNVPWKVYLNGIDLSCGTLKVMDTALFYKFTLYEGTYGGVHSAWIDDIKTYNNANGLLTGYDALQMGFSGLQPRQSIQLVAEDGSIIDQGQWQTGYSNIFLSFNPVPAGVIPGPAPSGAYSYYENGDNAKTTLRIYAEDGTLEYQSPLTRFFVGERYTYARPTAFADELVKTRSGDLYWPAGGSGIYADEFGNCENHVNGITCSGTWIWRTADVAGAQTNAVRGSYVHVTPFDYGVRTHYFTVSPSVPPPGYFMTYARIPEGGSPDGIGLEVYTGTSWKKAYWGANPSDSSTAVAYMGPVPLARNQWIQLVVNSGDLGMASSNWYGVGYAAGGGEVEWDVTTTKPDASLVVSGLSAIAGSGLTVGVYYANNGTLIATGSQSGDTASVLLYNRARGITSFPVNANIKIYDGSNEYYFGPARNIWPGDNLRYLGASSFFDSKSSGTSYWPSSTIHNAQIGAKRFSGDCLDAVLCYDMESLTEGATTVDTGTVTVSMKDLSGKGNDGTATDPSLSTIAKSAAGLASSFDGTSSKLLTANTLLSGVTASVTISAWVYVPSTSDKGAFVKVGSGPAINGYGLGVGTGSWDTAGNHLIGLYEGVRWIDTATSIGTGVHHVAMVISSSSVPSFYLDGNLLGSFSGSNPIAPTTPTAVGGYNNDGSHPRFFTGTIDQVLVYNKALTATQILALFHSSLPGAPQVYIRPQTNGFPVTSRVPYEGTYLAAAATYDAKGNIRTLMDTGIPHMLFYDMETCLAMPCASGGSVVDLSSNSNNGLIGTGVTVGAGGKIGQAATFPGTATGYVAAPTSFVFPTASFTIAFWTYPTALPASNTFFFGATSPTQGVDAVYALQNNGVFQCILVNSAGSYYSTPTATLSVNTWAHVACTFDGATYRLYINGVQQGSGTAFSGTPIAAQANFEVGDYVGFTGMTGKIDEVHIIPQGLSLLQIVSDLYSGGTATTHVYSTLDGQDYRTQINRPDGKQIYYAYDFQTGVKYGTLDVDCRRSRTQYDAIGRPLQTSLYDMDSNEVLHLDMETATSNSLKDVSCAGTTSSSNGQSVTMVGTAEVAGVDGSARSFNGGERLYVSSPSGLPLGSSSRTLTAWIYASSYPASNAAMVISYGTTSATGYAFSLGIDPSGNVISDLQGARATSTLVVPQNSWHFIAATYTSGTSVSLTLDTISQTKTYSGSVTPNTQSGELDVGAWIAGSCCLVIGRIDEARLFTRTLSAPELTDVMNRKYKLLTVSSTAYDDMTAFPEFGGYPGTSVTSYDGISTSRSLFFDMESKKVTVNSVDYLEDLSGSGNHGKVTGTTAVAGKVGNAKQFNGISDKIVSPAKVAGLQSWSFALWIYYDGTSSNAFQHPIGLGTGHDATLYVEKTSSHLNMKTTDSAGNTVVDAVLTTIATNTWYHVTVTFDGTYLSGYVNGVLQGAAQSGSGTAIRSNSVKIGSSGFETSNFFGGRIDEVHVASRALSASEVATFYAGYNQGTSSPTNYPTGNSGSTTDCGGTDGGDWTNPANAYSGTDGGASATAAPSAGMIICADWNTFNFNVPAGAVINSVKVTTSYKISGTSGNHYGLHVGLVDTNGGITNCPYQEDSSQPTVLTQVTFDFTSCKSWSSADFNNNNIKIDVGGHRGTGGGQAKTFSLDYVSIQVSYTVGSSNSIDGSHLSRKYMDGLGRPVRQVVLDMYGNKIQTVATLGWNDQPTYSYIPSGGYFTYAYDFLGRTLTVQTPGDSATSGIQRTIASEMARMTESIDAVGRKVYQKTDLLGRTVETAVWNPQTSAYGNLTSTTYNALSEVTVSKDAKLQTTTVYYNSLGKPKMTIFPDGTYSVVYYDDNLRAFQTVDVMGRVAVSAYDSIGRVTSITLQPSLGTSCTGTPNPCVVAYTYDTVHDDLLTIDNSTAKITRTYDSLHRMKTERLDVPSSSPTFTGTVSYDYDSAGKILNVTYPISGSPKAVYTYDSLGRAIQVAYGGSKYAVLTYDAFGRLDNIRYWKGSIDTSLQEKYAYDARDRVTQIKVFDSGQTYMQLDYTTYSKASEIIGSTDNMYVLDGGGVGSNPKTITYSYDGNGRLSRAVGPFGASQATEYDCYDYDQVGNIAHWGKGTTSCPTSGATYYTYNPTGWNQLASITNLVTSFGYNTAGSMLSKVEGATTTYTQDFLQQLTTVVSGANTYTYSYDGLGRRVKTVDSSTSTTSYFMYSGGKMLYSKVGTAPTETVFVYVGDNLLLKKEGALDAEYYHNDISAGNVRLITHYNAGIIVDARYRYKPFGDIIVLTTPGTDPRFKFAGTEFDSAVRLYQMGARYYDPVVGRFVSRDPIGGHGYAYAHDDPVAFRDPSGLDPWWHLFAPIAARPAGAQLIAVHMAPRTKEVMATASWFEGASPQQRTAFVLSFLVNMGIGIGAGGLELGAKICGAVGATGCAQDLARHAAAGVHWGEADAYNYFGGRLGAAPSAEGASHSAFLAPTARALGPIVLALGVGAITDVPEVLDTGAAGEAGDAAAAAADAADTVGAGSASDLPDSFAEFFARQDDMMRSWEFYNVPYPDSAFEQLGNFMELSESGYEAGVEGPTLREALRFIVEHGPLEAGTAEAAYRILRQLSGNGGKPAPIGPIESVAAYMP